MADGAPAIGEVLDGRYEVLGELGRGGMATVYRGRDRRLERDVALKVFHEGFAEAVDPRRTRQEAQMLSGVDHPSVVSMFDASNGANGSRTYLVMEFVDGQDLGTLLGSGPVAADFARRIAADVASALELLHERGIVHRDVKPANILVRAGTDRDATGITAKLTDFGIAQMVDASRITTVGTVVGTAAYLSPEQVKGARVRPASDIYALGLVLLECLTGERAFTGPSTESAIARLTRPPALPPTASPALADLLSRMTALDPSSRPRAAEVAEALRGTLVGAVTAPETVMTAPTPVTGVRGAPIAATGDDDFESTAPVQQVWDADAELAEFGLVAVDTGAADARVDTPAADRAAGTGPTPTGTTDTARGRTRFPLGLAIAASVVATVTVGAILSSVLGFTSPSTAATAGALTPASSAPPVSTAPVIIVPAAPVEQPSSSPTPTPTPSATPSATPSPTPTPTPTPSATPTPSVTPSATPAVTPSDSASPSATPAVVPVIAPSAEPSASAPVAITQ